LKISKKLRLAFGNGLWPTVAFVVVVFSLGGGSRADIYSLAVLRPLAALFLAYGLVAGARQRWPDYRFLVLYFVSIVALALVHLIPLPPALWEALPGRDLLRDIGGAAGIEGAWRPLTISPQDGLNAALSLIVPGAMLFLAIRLADDEHNVLAVALVLLGFASIFLGLLQIQGPDKGLLYFYRVTNDGKMVGLFANRNHNAIYLATIIPVLAYLASLPARDIGRMQLRLTLCVMGAISVFASLVIIGSRAGFFFAVLGAIAALAIFQTPRILSRRHTDQGRKHRFSATKVKRLGFAAVALVAAAFFAFAQSETMERVLESDHVEDLRFKILGPTIDMAWSYFPLGSGIGSFVEAYKIDEPVELLAPRYLNHAHNDLLEVLLTFGLPGLLLLGTGAFAWGVAALRVFRASADQNTVILRARLGAIVVGLLALASLVDYPLRTPSMACFFVIAAVWIARGCLQPRA
jgi:O-antigen ligase